ncbi:MAG: metallophosphoesterase [Acetobacteraceae bacterium]|nr:metallophosphoesterase [Acetobacteraceae bacterium]
MSDYVQFGNTTGYAIPALSGAGDQGVLRFEALARDETILVKPDLGTTGTVDNWTLGFDILIPAGQGTWTSFLQTSLANGDDGELFIRATNAAEGGIGISSVYEGAFEYGAWQRVVFTATREGDTTTLRKYIDGELVGTQALTGTRWQLDADDGLLILSDNDGDVSGGFLSSFLFAPAALAADAIAALGGADADGFFATAPVAGATQFDFAAGTYAATFGPGDLSAPADQDAPAAPALAVANRLLDVMNRPGSVVTIDIGEVFNRDDVTLTIESDDASVVTSAVIDGDVLTLTLGALGHADLRLVATDAEGNRAADNFRVRTAGENAYTIAVLPDTQDYTDASLANGPPETFYAMTKWLVESRDAKNIVFVGHVGDVTQDNLASHWEVANRALSTLDGKIPYSLLPGNHDQAAGGTAADHSSVFLDALFSPARQAASNPTTFGGVYDREPERGVNNYHTFEAPDGTDWLVLSLEFGPRDDIIRWAGDVIGAHLDHQVILLSHSLTNWAVRHDPAGGPLYDEGAGYDYGMGRSPEGANDGETVYRELLARFPNVAMTFSGHIFGDGAETNVSYSQHGNRIVESLVNYQNGVAREITGNGDAALGGRGGNGAIRLVTIDPDNKRVTTETYFTVFDDYLDGFRIKPERDRDGLTGTYLGHEEVFENWDLSTPAVRAVADAGDDIFAAASAGAATATVTLDAGRTLDPGGVAATYTWRDADGDVVASGETGEVALGIGRHALTLVVTDTAGNETRDQVLVVVTGDRTTLADNFNDGNTDGWLIPGQEDGLVTGTPESFGLPAISGGEESVLFLPALPATKALTLTPNLGAPAGTLVGDYSLVFDILVPDGQGTWTSFIQLNTANADDGELFIRSNGNGTGGIGISENYTGSFEYGAWQRVGFVFDDLGNGTTTLAKYINGVKVGTQTLLGDRWKLDVGAGALLFSDESGETSDLYVSSVLITDKVFTDAEMTALGGTRAGGILAASPTPTSVQFDFGGADLAATYGVSTLGFGAIGSGTGNFIVKGTVFARPAAEPGQRAPEARVFDQSDADGNVLLWSAEEALGWKDYVLELTLRSTDNDGIGAVFGWQDVANHLRVELNSETNTRSLVRVEDGVETVLAAETGGSRFNADQALKIAFTEVGITAFLDGRLMFGGTVATAEPFGTGTVGLWSDTQRSSQFDTVTVNTVALDAHAGNDQRLLDRDGDGAETVTVSAAGTFGPDALVSYEWRDAAGELRGTGAEASFDLGVGFHRLTLTVTDAAGAVSTDRVDIEVVGRSRIWLDEDFSGEGMPAGWRIVDEGEFGGIGEGGLASDWRIENGALTQFSDLASRQLVWNGASNADVWRQGWSPHGDGVNTLRKGTYALFEGEGAGAWKNYALETTITTPDNDGLGVLIHYIDDKNYYKLELDSDGTYDRSPGNGAGPLFTLTRVRDGVEEILGQVPQRYTVGEAFDLRVEILDQKISAFIDGSEIFAYAIEDRSHAAGTVGLYSWGNAGVAFDDVTVIGLDAVAEPIAAPVLSFLQGGAGRPQGSLVTGPAVDAATLGDALSVTTGGAGTLIENTGRWNDIKAAVLAADDYMPAMGTAFTVANFVDVRLDLSGAVAGVEVDVWGAKRGGVTGSAFADEISWTAHSNEARWSNLVTLDAGAGDDTITLASVGGANGAAGWLADNDDPANGPLWNAAYAGARTVFSVTLGAGEDRLVVNRDAGRVTVADFGAEDALVLAGFAAGATLAHQGGGVWQVFEDSAKAGQTITLADQGAAVTTLVAGEDYLFV